MAEHGTTTRRKRLAVAIGVAVVLGLLTVGPPREAAAQGWWPWASDQRPPPPPPPQQRQQIPAPIPQQPPPQQARPGTGGPICLQLEQRLVQEAQKGNQVRDVLPKLEGEMRQLEQVARRGDQQLEQAQCYEYFLFSKTLRRSRQCLDLVAQLETSRRRLMELDAQRQQIMASGGRSLQDDLIRELARNNCGATYQQEAAKRGSGGFGSWWQDEDTGPTTQGGQVGNLPYATYRTICVRLCDGYYFPISFATLQNHFQRDADACQSRCAAPVELYYHQNPGAGVEQALSFKSQQPYMGLKTALKYRQSMVQGCSCKQAEYVPSAADRGERKAEAPIAPTRPQR